MGTPLPSPKRGRSPLLNLRPVYIVATWLDVSRWHLAWRWALVHATSCQMGTKLPSQKGGRAPSVLIISFFPEPPPLCKRHPTVFAFYLPNVDSSITHLQIAFLDDCQSPSSQLLQVWKILTHCTQKQLDKIHNNSSLNATHSARNLGFIFDEHLTFSDQFSAISKACYHHVRQLRCILPYLDSNTACTVATSIVHSKLDYCNFLYYNLPKSQITRLQLIWNSFARAVLKAPKSCHAIAILRSLHWLEITERNEHKPLSLIYRVLTTTQPSYLHNLISV